MKKIILTILLSAIMIFSFNTAMGADAPVIAVDGNVTVNAEISAEDGTPVILFILPQIIENNVDKTAEKVSGLTSSALISSLNVEHIGLAYVDNGSIFYECVMSDALPTGVCHVVLSHIGAQECYSIGTFEHVGTTDKNNLVRDMNSANKDTCSSVIDEDIFGKIDETDGVTRLTPKEVLRKSFADVAYYNSLSDKTQFHALLYKLKGDTPFTLVSLVDCFNKTGVWMRLRFESDTLGVLNTYNGTGVGKYWNVEIGEGSDFDSLSTEEKLIVLGEVKDAGYEEKEAMETGFNQSVALALLRSAQTREDIEAVISETGSYASYFTGVRTIISAAALDEYYTALLYTNVLPLVKNCRTVGAVESAFSTSIPVVPDDPDPDIGGDSYLGSGGGGGGGHAMTYEPEKIPQTQDSQTKPAMAFKDVQENHWAKDYIKVLYEKGIINGFSESVFAPSESIARQDFVKILIGAMGVESTVASLPFKDVEKGSYYEPYVKAAYEKKLVSGTSDSSFGVGSFITREDAAVIMSRAIGVVNASEKTEQQISFTDIENASSYAKDAILKMADIGIFTGDQNGKFNPKGNLSRAETCAILCRFTELLKGGM